MLPYHGDLSRLTIHHLGAAPERAGLDLRTADGMRPQAAVESHTIDRNRSCWRNQQNAPADDQGVTNDPIHLSHMARLITEWSLGDSNPELFHAMMARERKQRAAIVGRVQGRAGAATSVQPGEPPGFSNGLPLRAFPTVLCRVIRRSRLCIRAGARRLMWSLAGVGCSPPSLFGVSNIRSFAPDFCLSGMHRPRVPTRETA
jgi:hypothetical protein